MSRLPAAFAGLRASGKKALVTYLCIGDPDIDASYTHAMACVAGGADVLELGCPFSDPSADGPAIARASTRALARGGGLSATLEVAARIRRASEVPLVLFGYYNPLFVRGEGVAVDQAAAAGIDALLVVDLPLDEGALLRARAHARGVGLVPLHAPTSTGARARAIRDLEPSPPFVYYVSVAGVTGSSVAPLAEASARAGALRELTRHPVVVGFGVHDPESARIAASHADGVVVGTALVRTIEDAVALGLSREAQGERLRALVARLAAAVHED